MHMYDNKHEMITFNETNMYTVTSETGPNLVHEKASVSNRYTHCTLLVFVVKSQYVN